MKPTLLQYIDSHSEANIRALNQKDELLFQDYENSLKACKSADDFVAVKTLCSRKCDDKTFKDQFCAKVSELSISCWLPLKVGDEKHLKDTITFIVSFPEGQHLNLIASYLFSIILSNDYININIIVTGEHNWFVWRGTNNNKWLNSIYSTLKLYAEERNLEWGLVERRVNIHFSPSEAEYGNIVSQVVVIFMGVYYKKSTFIYNQILNEHAHVYSATFTSSTDASLYAKTKLVRYDTQKSDEVKYVTPVISPIHCSNSEAESHTNKDTIVSIHSQDRLNKALNKFREDQWGLLNALFSQYKSLRWALIGTNNPEGLSSLLDTKIKAEYRSRVEVYQFCDLSKFVSKILIHLTLEKVYGGGGAANLSFCNKVPVIAYNDKLSDISNNTVESTQVEDFYSSIMLITKLVSQIDFYNDFVHRQYSFYKSRYDLKSKGNELLNILNGEL